jgi:replicative DNA helicase
MLEYSLIKEICTKQNPDLLLSLEDEWFLEPIAKDMFKFLKANYIKSNEVPNLASVEAVFSTQLLNDIPDTNIGEYLVSVVQDRYTKHKFYSELLSIIDSTETDTAESILDQATSTILQLSSIVGQDEEVFDVSDEIELETLNRKSLGLGKFDEVNGGMSPSELMILGGHRGSGKSILLLNMGLHNYIKHRESVILFSIEMRKEEIYSRLYAMISGVSATAIAKNQLTEDEYYKIQKAIVATFYDKHSDEASEFMRLCDEKAPFSVLKTKKTMIPKAKNSFLIVDKPSLTINNIYYYCTKFKQQYHNVKTFLVDYLNIIKGNSNDDPMDWKQQISKANDLKILARELDMKGIAPFQTDDEGKVRYAKGIEDPVDYSLIFKAEKKAGQDNNKLLTINTAKIRNGKAVKVQLEMDGDSLRVDNVGSFAMTEEQKEKAPSSQFKQRNPDVEVDI